MRILGRKKFEKAISEANYLKQQIKKSQDLKDTFGSMLLLKEHEKILHKKLNIKTWNYLCQLMEKNIPRHQQKNQIKENAKPKSWIYSKSQFYRKNSLEMIDFCASFLHLNCFVFFLLLSLMKKQTIKMLFLNARYANFQFVPLIITLITSDVNIENIFNEKKM
ncbi:hypothetical protein RFI_03040 [Reticulomyxa filosa]|uniref:Uncharacterized protein n=1 Tax=Reticulomyxa filosa TaxID=46433 RepID=X6P7L5_RETFI|nr:hypothetical protein RFI_03040 [Reticulomyxa filosa]|eukprot:ETO34054.1 hypothetical protein RFI_03040 [Reticulomyxa filosa]